VTAEQQGKLTSTLFWPGSETPINGVQPHDWLNYDDHMSSIKRVSQLLEWINRTDIERADFATLYFSEIDIQFLQKNMQKTLQLIYFSIQ